MLKVPLNANLSTCLARNTENNKYFTLSEFNAPKWKFFHWQYHSGKYIIQLNGRAYTSSQAQCPAGLPQRLPTFER